MLEVAEELNCNDLRTDIRENKARAEQAYIGNYYMITDFIREIDTDYIAMSDFYVYLPKEELLELNRYEKVTVVGKIDTLSGAPILEIDKRNNRTIFEIKDAHYVTNAHEITGVVQLQDIVPYQTYDELWYCRIRTEDEFYYNLTEHLPEDANNTIYNDKMVIINDMEVRDGSTVKFRGTVAAGEIKNGVLNISGTYVDEKTTIVNMESFEILD